MRKEINHIKNTTGGVHQIIQSTLEGGELNFTSSAGGHLSHSKLDESRLELMHHFQADYGNTDGQIRRIEVDANQGIIVDGGQIVVTDSYPKGVPSIMVHGNAADRLIQTRGIDGSTANGALGDLYLNYNNPSGTVYIESDVAYKGVRPGQTLWTGAWHMSNSQTVTPSKRLSECPNGWALIFGYYTSGTSYDYNFNTTFIHKAYASHYNGAGMFALNAYNGSDKLPANKYLYVSGNQISGHASNSEQPSSRMVLRRVIAW